MLQKLVTLAFLTLMAAVGLAVPVMVPGSADHAKGIDLNRTLVAVNATPAANLCDCPYNAVGWTLIDGECTCELPANKTSGMRVIPVMIESQKKRDALAENNIDLDQIEERSLGCRFYQCDNMKNPVEQNGVCVCVDALGTGGWERDTTTLNEFEKKRDVSMEVDVSKPNGQVRALKGRGKCPFNNPFCEYFVPLNNGECACIPYLRGINQHVGRADKE